MVSVPPLLFMVNLGIERPPQVIVQPAWVEVKITVLVLYVIVRPVEAVVQTGVVAFVWASVNVPVPILKARVVAPVETNWLMVQEGLLTEKSSVPEDSVMMPPAEPVTVCEVASGVSVPPGAIS